MKVKKGDTVQIMKGKDRGKSGKIVRSFPKENMVIVEGLNVVKKHQKAKKGGQSGQIIEVAMPINVSNVQLANKTKNKK